MKLPRRRWWVLVLVALLILGYLYVSSKSTVKIEAFYSESLDHKMHYAVYLPPGYHSIWHIFTRYPVVYLLPGSTGGIRSWGLASLREQMDTLLAQQQLQPMILVVPEETLENSAKDSNGGYVDGPLGNWATYTTGDVVDEIDTNYRTVKSKDGRVIAGNSEGGYGAMNLGLKNPTEFRVIGSFSGYYTIDERDLSYIFGGDQSLAEENSPMLYLPQLEGELPAIYLVVGQDDKQYLAENQRFARELQARDARLQFDTVSGGHQTKEYLADFLIFAGEHLTGGG